MNNYYLFFISLIFFYFFNIFLINNKILLDKIDSSQHKKFLVSESVPLSGGSLIFIAIIFFGRVLPHPYNFTPLIAVTLLSSYSLSNKLLVIAIPIFGFWLSD